MNGTRAVYAGSFDMPTKGHEHVIGQALRLFDHLTIAVANNPDKRHRWSLNTRQAMLRTIMESVGSVNADRWTITDIGNQLLVDWADKNEQTHLVRGIRNMADFEYERGMAALNRRFQPEIETVFLMPPVELAETSSSLVKGLIGLDGWELSVLGHLPLGVLALVLAKPKGD